MNRASTVESIGVQCIVLHCLLCMVVLPATSTEGAFIESPTSQNVSIGEDAVFRCQHDSADTIRWRVNGVLVSRSSPPTGVHEDADGLVDTLTITGSLEYNGTEVVCVAQFDSGSPDQESTPAYLHVHVTEMDVFIDFPISLNVTSGTEAVFRCRHSTASAVVWKVNGTSLTSLPHLENSFKRSDNILTVTALLVYHSTEIQCTAHFSNRSNVDSPSAVLDIQGPLAAVTSLTKNDSTFFWEAPFSLNLTNIDPDIVYCVDVYNITCGGRDLVSSDCHVTSTNYTAFSDGYLYEYVVTPRSNVEAAGNGTQSHWRDKLPTFSVSSTEFSLPTSGSIGNYRVVMAYTPVLPIPSSYALSLEALDGLGSLSCVETTATEEQPNQLLLDVSGLESRRLWNYTILAFGCQDNSILRGEILSTHDFWNISISPFSGAVRVTGRYIEGSPATGVLVIVSGDSDSYYHIATRDGSDIQEATVTGIAGGEYSVSVFVVEENGLPFERAANLPSPLSMEENNIEHPSPSIDYSLESTSSGVCVKCTFLDTDASECVAVVHRNLTNIERSSKFTRSGDIASGCIEGVNLEDYQVGVIGGRLLKSGPAQTNNLPVIIGASLATAVVIVIVLAIILIILYCHKRVSRSRVAKSPQFNLYSSVPAPPTENPRDPLVIPSIHVPPSGGIYDTAIDINSTPNSAHSSSSSSGGASQPTAVTSGDEAGEGNENTSHYAAVDAKPQPVSIPPVDDSRMVYAEVNQTLGAKEQSYTVDLKKGITESNPDDLTKVSYSDICTVGVQKPSTVFNTNPLRVPPPVPFTAELVFFALLPVAFMWQAIGEAFPLSEKRLDDIGTTEGDEECLRQMIEAYMLRRDLSHTWDEVVNVLKKIGEDSLADKIFKLHVAPKSDVINLPNQPQIPQDTVPNLHKVCADDGLTNALAEGGPTVEADATHSLADKDQPCPDYSKDVIEIEGYDSDVPLPSSTDENPHDVVLEMPSDDKESTEVESGLGRVDTEESGIGRVDTEESGIGRVDTEESGLGRVDTEESGLGRVDTEESGLGRSRVRTDGDSELSEGCMTSESDHSSVKPSIENLMDYLLPMSSKWKDLGEALSLEEDVLIEVFTTNETHKDCLREMLLKYLERTDLKHSWAEIDEARERVKACDLGGMTPRQLIPSSTHALDEKDIKRAPLCSAGMTIINDHDYQTDGQASLVQPVFQPLVKKQPSDKPALSDSKEDSSSQDDKEASTDVSDKFSDMDSGCLGGESPQPITTSTPVCNPSSLTTQKKLPTGVMPPRQLFPSSTALTINVVEMEPPDASEVSQHAAKNSDSSAVTPDSAFVSDLAEPNSTETDDHLKSVKLAPS